MSQHYWGEFQTHALHVVPSMGPIVSVVNSHGRQNCCSRKADQSTKPGNGTVCGQCMSVAISWNNKMEQAYCDNLVSFPKSSHIFDCGISYKLYHKTSSQTFVVFIFVVICHSMLYNFQNLCFKWTKVQGSMYLCN